MKPRLGFLGVGWIGRSRLDAIAGSGLAEVVGICDPNPALAGEAAALAPRAALVPSLDDLLALRLDGLVIATPSALHARQCLDALRKDVAVFCQKPLGRTAAETREIVERARRGGRLLGVDLSYRHVEAARRVADLARSGALGRIYAADLYFHNAYGPDKAWFYDRALSGGGCVIDLGTHLVDLALWCLGFPRLTGVGSRLFEKGRPLDGRGVEDYAETRLDLENGAVARVSCSWKLPAGRDALIGAAFYGSEGGAGFHNVNGSFYDFTAERFLGTERRTLAGPPDAWGGRAAVDWTRRLAAGEGYDPACEEFTRVAEAIDAIYGAA
jgi:predicted dehydrogenase